MRRMSFLAGLVLFTAAGCSDDAAPLTLDGGGDAGDGSTKSDHRLDSGYPWDGFDPSCPMPGPCILKKKGEDQHASEALVIGELLTLTGKDLKPVQQVFIGAAPALMVSVTSTRITCRVGVGTPSGVQTVEIKFGTSRRMFGSIKIARLALIGAADYTKIQTFDSVSHSAFAVLDLGQAPAARPALSTAARFLIARGASKLMVADLALEKVATVSGLAGETPASWATDDKDRLMVIATGSGKLLSVDLTVFPTLTAKAIAGAPVTLGVAVAGGDLFVGLHPTAAAKEASVWYAKQDLKTFSWAMTGAAPFKLGSGTGLKALGLHAADGAAAVLAQDGAAARLGALGQAAGALQGKGSVAAAGGFDVVVAAGGAHVALSADSSAPILSHLSLKKPSALSAVTLGSGGASRVAARHVPSAQDTVVALVGPKPTKTFEAAALEMVDLSKGLRLTAAGKPALTLASMRDAAGHPLEDRIHLITGTAFKSFKFVATGSAVSFTEVDPHQLLDAGKDYRWLTVQP